MKIYLLVYGRELGTRTQIKTCLDALPQVKSWRAEIPNSFFIKSEAGAKELGEGLRACLGIEKPKYFLLEIPQADSDSNWGWLVHDSWVFLGRKSDDKK